MKQYAATSYDARRAASRGSAEILVPHVVELIRPTSVVDVGCSTGTWLRAFQAVGVGQILGLDGDSVRLDQLEIPPDRFQRANLEKPLKLDRRFDLAVSLEVAEHLPESSAAAFVDSLVAAAPVVLFSAAVPGQGGYHHQNEQWQSWWAAQFVERGYRCVDCLRGRFWYEDHIRYWYRQNALFYVEASLAPEYSRLLDEEAEWCFPALDVVHPAMYRQKRFEPGLQQVLESIPGALMRAGSRRLRRKGQ